jgi:hypothetical protein
LQLIVCTRRCFPLRDIYAIGRFYKYTKTLFWTTKINSTNYKQKTAKKGNNERL